MIIKHCKVTLKAKCATYIQTYRNISNDGIPKLHYLASIIVDRMLELFKRMNDISWQGYLSLQRPLAF